MPTIDVHAYFGATPWFQADQDGLLRAMQRAGIDRTVVTSRLGLESNFAEGNFKLNATMDGLAAAAPEPPLLGYVAVNPAYLDTSVQEMRRYLAARSFVGIALDPHVTGQPLDSEAGRSLVNSFRRFSKPLLTRVRSEEEVRALANLAQAHPNVRMIVAHAGPTAWAACLALAERQLNLFLEPFTGGAERHKLEEAAERIGAHRLLFGTSFPDLSPGVALGLLADARLTDADKNLIRSANAVKLFNLAAESQLAG